MRNSLFVAPLDLHAARRSRRTAVALFAQSAPSGSPRRLAIRAVWQSAPSGNPRRLAVRAV
jgi:hypothetical protein